jgi:hypothetical protein
MTSYKDISIQESDGDEAFDALMNNEKQINLQYENKPKMAEKFKTKSVTFKNEFDTQNGKFFNFTVESEAGVTGTYVSKSKDQTKFKVGEEIEVEITSDERWGNKIKVAQTNTPNGGGFQRKPFDAEADKFKQVLILAQSSMAKVVDMANHKIIEYKDLQAACDKIMQQQLDLAHKYKDYTPL